MPTVVRIDAAGALFAEVEHHLLCDGTPSAFLNACRRRREFREYPFALLDRLRETRQSPKHHPEGNVWNHTMLVVDEAAGVKHQSRDPRAFLWAALLHDIGKPPTTRLRNGRITSYDHDKVGAGLAGQFLGAFAEDAAFIGRVVGLVRYHMHILYVDNDLPFADIAGMLRRTDVREVALLGLCDRLGRMGADRAAEEANIRLFLQKVQG